MTDKQLNRYKGDHLAQQFWAIKRGLQRPINLFERQRPYKPPKFRVHGAGSVSQPVVLGYELLIPYWHEVGYEGEIVIITTRQFGELWDAFAEAGLSQEFSAYMANELCPLDCWCYDSVNDLMKLTTYGRCNSDDAAVVHSVYAVVDNWLKRGKTITESISLC